MRTEIPGDETGRGRDRRECKEQMKGLVLFCNQTQERTFEGVALFWANVSPLRFPSSQESSRSHQEEWPLSLDGREEGAFSRAGLCSASDRHAHAHVHKHTRSHMHVPARTHIHRCTHAHTHTTPSTASSYHPRVSSGIEEAIGLRLSLSHPSSSLRGPISALSLAETGLVFRYEEKEMQKVHTVRGWTACGFHKAKLIAGHLCCLQGTGWEMQSSALTCSRM